IKHSHCNAAAFKLVHFMLDNFSILTFEFDCEFTFSRHNKISGAILITESVTSNDDRAIPGSHYEWDILENNRLTEDSTIKYVPNCPIRTLPHLFEVEFLFALFVRSDVGTFNSYPILLNRIGRINSNLVVCLL